MAEYRAPITLDCTARRLSARSTRLESARPFLNKVAVWTLYAARCATTESTPAPPRSHSCRKKAGFGTSPARRYVSVGVVAEGKYLARDGVKSPELIFKREIEQNLWIKQHLACGAQTGPYYITSEYTHHSRFCGSEGLLLVGDAFCFLDPVFSSGLMFALKSGCSLPTPSTKLSRTATSLPRRFSRLREPHYARASKTCASSSTRSTIPNFSFRTSHQQADLDAGGDVTDCLSGDVNKDFSDLWKKVSEFVRLPEDLPVGGPLFDAERAA